MGKVYARSFYDLDSTSYFLDPANAAGSIALAVAGSVGIGNNNPALTWNGTNAVYLDVRGSLGTPTIASVSGNLIVMAGGKSEGAILNNNSLNASKLHSVVTEPAFDDLLKNFETSINDGIETTAEEKGDGMQRALMLAIIKTYSDYRREKDELGKSFVFLIDEAELHLHPTAQRQLKEALILLAENGDQVFVILIPRCSSQITIPNKVYLRFRNSNNNEAFSNYR